MTEIQKCPTCGRRPSERTVRHGHLVVSTEACHDPIHALADLGPAAVALLREIAGSGGRWASMGDIADTKVVHLRRKTVKQVDALLAAAPEVKP